MDINSLIKQLEDEDGKVEDFYNKKLLKMFYDYLKQYEKELEKHDILCSFRKDYISFFHKSVYEFNCEVSILNRGFNILNSAVVDPERIMKFDYNRKDVKTYCDCVFDEVLTKVIERLFHFKKLKERSRKKE